MVSNIRGLAAVVALFGSVAVGFTAAAVVTTSGTAGATGAAWTASTAPTEGLSPPPVTSGMAPESVSCPTATSCVAVGHYIYGGTASESSQYLGLIETGSESDGVWTWQAETAPTDGLSPELGTDTEYPDGFVSVDSVSCGTPTSCVAVGRYDIGTDAEHTGQAALIETGTNSGGSWSWTPQSVDSSNLDPPVYTFSDSNQANLGGVALQAVSCSGASCVAVGDYGVLTGEAGGESISSDSFFATNASGSWTTASVPSSGLNPAPSDPNTSDFYPTLNAVSCSSTTTCVAVGGYEDVNDAEDGFIETGTLSEGTWSWQPSNTLNPKPSTTPEYSLRGVSCPTTTSCVVAGENDDKDVIETGTLSGGSWTWVVNTPASSDNFANGESVSCPSVASCVIASSFDTPKIETGTASGGKWTWSLTPIPTSGVDPPSSSTDVPALSGVSCISETCVALGTYTDSDGNTDGLIVNGVLATSPMVNSVSPGGGPIGGGNEITIAGSDFDDSSLTFEEVDFDPGGGGAPIVGTDPSVVNASTITVTAPSATTEADGAAFLSTQVQVVYTETADPSTKVIATAAGNGTDTLTYVFGAPVVDSVDPAAGPLAGGTSITVSGSGFANADLKLTGSTFSPVGDTGGTELDGVSTTVVSDTEITLTSPSATTAANGSPLLVTTMSIAFSDKSNPDGPGVEAVEGTTNGTIFRYVFGAPIVDSISPRGGPLAGGNTVTITGSDFKNSDLTFDKVTFTPQGGTGGTVLDGTDPIVVSDTEITVTAPDAMTAAGANATLTATVQVVFDDPSSGFQVQAAAGSSGTDIFSYVFGAPVVDSVSPPAGPLAGGNTVTITGSGFLHDASLNFDKVVFDPTSDTDGSEFLTGLAASVVSDTEITVTAPDASSAAGFNKTLDAEVDVYFTETADPSTTVKATVVGDANAYTFGTPVVDSVSPAAGPLAGGNTVTITGSDFEDANLTFEGVQFDPDSDTDGSTALDGLDATVVSDTEITVTVPDATTAAGDANTLDTEIKVVYEDPADSDTQILATNASDGVNAYLSGVPVVDSVAPAAGPLAGGNTVTITGSGFENSGLTFDDVDFSPSGGAAALDGVDATVVSDTEITVTAPDATEAAGGKSTLDSQVEVLFTDPAKPDTQVQAQPKTAGEGILDYGFGVPIIDSVDPVHGPLGGGNTVTITGSGFQDAGLTLDGVSFDPTADSDVTEPIAGTDATVVSDTEITVTAPNASGAAAAASGGAVETTVNVYFTDPGQSGDLAAVVNNTGDNDYEFGAPTISSISPVAGPLAGGNTVTITGNGFEDEGLTLGKVQFAPDGGAPLDATNVDVVSDTEITVKAPDATSTASPASTLSTTVQASFSLDVDPSSPFNATTSDGGSAAYDFGAPQISSVSPQAGSQTGGKTITITGSGFTSNTNLTLTSVQFDPTGGGAIDGVSPSVVNDTTITVTSPDVTPQAAGVSSFATAVTLNFEDTGDSGSPLTAVVAAGGSDTFDFDLPTVDSIAPDRGPLAGGNEITVTGSGFEDLGLTYDSLTFQPEGSEGSDTPLEATNVTVVSDTEITATVPDGTDAAAGQPAVESMLVVNFTDPANSGAPVQSVPEAEDDDTYWFGIPTVESVSPTTGPMDGGNEITITGSGFEDSGLSLNKVEFTPAGGTAMDGANPTVVSDTEITVDAPDATAAAGVHSSLATSVAAVFDYSGSSTQVESSPGAAGDDQYTFTLPTITSIDPGIGPLAGGNTITINGTGFQDLGLTSPTVSFVPVATEEEANPDIGADEGTDVTVMSDTELTVVTPDMTDAAAGEPAVDTTVTISFQNPHVEGAMVDSVAASAGDDDYWFGPPTISSISPVAGPLAGGNTVTITGDGFEDAGLTLTGVTFSPVGSTDEADDLHGTSPTVVSNTKITVVAPDAATAAGDSAIYETTVTLHFSDPAAEGQDIPSAAATEGDDDYDFGTPLITSIDPTIGPLIGGDTVTITGTGFDNPGLDLASVDFQPAGESNPSDALAGVDPLVVSDTEITVTAPDASTDAGGQGYLATTVTAAFTDPGLGDAPVDSVVEQSGDNNYEFGTPIIDSVSPALGPLSGGDEVTITGTGFENPELSFNGISFTPSGGDAADAIAGVDPVVVSDTEVTVTAPDATEAAGGTSTLDTTVSADYTDTSAGDAPVSSAPEAAGDNDYSFGEPIVDSVSPGEGPLSGGQQITITGSGFENPDLSFSGVTFEPSGEGDSAALVAPHTDVAGLEGTDATVVSDTEITVTTPDAVTAAGGATSVDTTVEAEFTDTANGDEQMPSSVGANGSDEYIFSSVASAPTHVAALAGVGSAMVTWSAPETSGDAAVNSYTVTSVPGGVTTTVAGTATSATLSGLDVGTAYYFDVSATSDDGTGPAAASNMIVPTSTPVVDSTSGTGTTPGGSVSTAPVTAAGGASLTADATGTGTVATGTYDTDPVAQLSDGTDYFDLNVSEGNTFSELTLEVCGLSPGQSLEWWNAIVDAWQAMSDQTAPSGSPLCSTATVTSSTSPSLAQLYGTVIAVVGSTGYWEVAGDGGIFSYGAQFHGSAAGLSLNQPVVGMAPTPNGAGYWLASSDGGVFTFGDAQYYGSLASRQLNRQVVGIASTPSGGGYWMAGADGGVFNFGNAPFEGSLVSDHVTLRSPVVGIAPTPSGDGYWLVAADGGVFAYGDAQFWGSAGSQRLDAPVVGIAATPDGGGYWLVAADGGVFAYGDAAYKGSMGGQHLNGPVVGMAASADGGGYWLVAADGGVFSFGDARFYGSAGGTRLASKVVGLATG